MEELYSLLVPLAHTRLILPRDCVAEVVGYAPEAAPDPQYPWMIGHMRWNEQHIPVVSFEAICGLDSPAPQGRVRVVVMRCLGNRLQAGFFGLISQGFPQLVRVNAAVLESEAESEWPVNSPVICQVRMINQRPVVPDLEQLEQMIAEAVQPDAA